MGRSTNKDYKTVLWKICFGFLIAGSLAVIIKMVMSDYTIDDAYHVVMSYRNAMGDRLFYEMWEPHQTSAFLCAAFIKLFIKVTGNTVGIVIFLRIVGLIIHGTVSTVFYKTIRDFIDEKPAVLIAIAFFNTFPKLSAVPEFLNMQLWFTTLFVCFFWRAYKCDFKSIWFTALSATFLSLSIVTYPTGVILAIITFLFLCMCKSNGRTRAICIFTVTCVSEAFFYLIASLSGKKISYVLNNIGNVISGDESHNGTNLLGENALVASFKGLGLLIIISISAIITARLLSYAVCSSYRKKESYKVVSFGILSVISLLCSAYYWLIKSTGYDCPKYFYGIVPILVCIELFGKENKVEDKTKRFILFAISISVGMLISVISISNVAFENNVPVMGIALFFGLAAICCIYADYSELVCILLAFVCVMSIGITGFTQKVSSCGSNVFQYNAIVLNDSVAKGVVGDWILKKYYLDAEEIVNNAVTDGDKMLVIANGKEVSSSSLYMIKDVEICQNSTICTPSYGDNYIDYFNEFPDKIPNVVIIERLTKDYADETFLKQYLFEKYDFSLQYETESYLLYRRE